MSWLHIHWLYLLSPKTTEVDPRSVPMAKRDKRRGERVGKGSADKIYLSLIANGQCLLLTWLFLHVTFWETVKEAQTWLESRFPKGLEKVESILSPNQGYQD